MVANKIIMFMIPPSNPGLNVREKIILLLKKISNRGW